MPTLTDTRALTFLSFGDTGLIAICQKDINQTVVYLTMGSLVQQVRFINKFSQLIFLLQKKTLEENAFKT